MSSIMKQRQEKQGYTQKSEKNYPQIDPTGQIRSCAQELWVKDGKPTERSWEDYWSSAEELMMGGRSGEGGGTQKVEKTIDVVIPGEVQKLIAQDKNPLLSILASSFKAFIQLHESLCLVNILSNHSFVLRDGSRIAESSVEDIAEILVELAREEDLEKRGSSQGSFAYWKETVAAYLKKDQALTYANLNTILRLLSEISSEERVLKCVYREGPPELA